jgi:hypothetical protein
LEKGVPIYDTRNMHVKGGEHPSPKYKIGEKMESSLVSSIVRSPGPGKYNPPVEASGQIKRKPSWGFTTSERFPKDRCRGTPNNY